MAQKKSNKSPRSNRSTQRRLSVYSNLVHKRKSKKDATSRKRAEYLASLPKHPINRLLHRMHPRNVARFWFSKRGAFLLMKVSGVAILFAVLVVGGLFAYYRRDLDSIRPGELSKRVQTTVTKYEDRNGNLLWEDKGDGDYKLVVKSDALSQNLKEATVAIEDKDFYKHGGISITGLIRAQVNNLQGGSIQGGSTLTQQLVKQVFLSEDANKRGLNGIPRKIKEMILSVEVERMYKKDDILTLYLNESSYGGRRNGVESSAQAFFGKSSKELTIPEAALLAGIPNQPTLYDPYYIPGHEALINRQHKVLDKMREQGYITQKESDDAKAYPILDNIKPELDQYNDIKAPHFVQMVRAQLQRQLGNATVGRGGLTVKTTLDIRIQNKLEESMKEMFDSYVPNYAGFTNGAATVEDTATSQIVAMMGSRDFLYPGFGQDNAAMSYIQPGSTIKPLVYAELFRDKGTSAQNYGSGSILADDGSMSKIYGAPLQNADQRFLGNVTIRTSLALSRNVPAVKAEYVSGVDPTLKTIRDLGDINYCTQGADAQAGLSSAIGGCGTRQVDHVTAFASLARMGVYKPTSTILSVTNSQGEVLEKYEDTSKRVVDPQVAYILADILSDDNARARLYGPQFFGLYIPNVKTASKTGTSDKGGKPKDIWTMSYSPALTMGVWLGNSDTQVLKNGNSSLPAKIVGQVMQYAHEQVYAPEGKWKAGDWYTPPAGIQTINGELFPSWYNKSKARTTNTISFDKISKKKATDCTPPAARIDVAVVTSQDPVTKKTIYRSTDGYDALNNDDVHNCSDQKPSVIIQQPNKKSDLTYSLTISANAGSNPLQSIDIKVNGTTVKTLSSSGSFSYTFADNSSQNIRAVVTDDKLYTNETALSFTPSSNNNRN